MGVRPTLYGPMSLFLALEATEEKLQIPVAWYIAKFGAYLWRDKGDFMGWVRCPLRLLNLLLPGSGTVPVRCSRRTRDK
jgi:hypothetical protein